LTRSRMSQPDARTALWRQSGSVKKLQKLRKRRRSERKTMNTSPLMSVKPVSMRPNGEKSSRGRKKKKQSIPMIWPATKTICSVVKLRNLARSTRSTCEISRTSKRNRMKWVGSARKHSTRLKLKNAVRNVRPTKRRRTPRDAKEKILSARLKMKK